MYGSLRQTCVNWRVSPRLLIDLDYISPTSEIGLTFIMTRAIPYTRNPYLLSRQASPPLYLTGVQRVHPGLPSITRTRRAVTSKQWTSAPREFPTAGFGLIDTSMEIEEETLPNYHPDKYYPVQQGEVLRERYQILAKLGYGVTSTVWFGKDLQ